MSQAAAGAPPGLDLDSYRPELRGYCYRMLGSTFDADDAVQDTLLKAWQGWERFEGRSSVRSWIYRIATNVCLDRLRSRERRVLPMDLAAPLPGRSEPAETLPEQTWIEPMRDGDVAAASDPAEEVVLRDTIRLAFVHALQHLPPRQRAVLILREVLSWQASEVAELLDTSVASVNSALQRARATLSAANVDPDAPVAPLDEGEQRLLQSYVAAFERYDVDALVALLHHDVSISMPPFTMWVRGRDELRDFYRGAGKGCEGSRLIPIAVNGAPAFAHYKPDPRDGRLHPWSIQVLEVADGDIVHIHHFIGPALFQRFGLPASLD